MPGLAVDVAAAVNAGPLKAGQTHPLLANLPNKIANQKTVVKRDLATNEPILDAHGKEQMEKLASRKGRQSAGVSRGGKGVPVYVQAFLTATGEKVPGTSDYYKLTRDDGNDRYTMKCPKEFMEHGVTLKTTIGFKGQAWKVAPALAAGNCIVLKPAEQTPLTALRFAQLAEEAGIPAGTVNIVPGYGPTAGAAICRHPGVDKLAFTGSTEVGRIVMREAAERIVPVTLELGGKSPLIVGKDVDVDKAVEDCHWALFFNHGQCCAAGSRTYVHADIYDEFCAKAAARAEKRVVGDPFQEGVEQGPQVDADQLKKILGLIDIGNREGARMLCGGKQKGTAGYYVEPTVFADVTDEMTIAREEIFGPVQCILKYHTTEEVIARANDSAYGLAAGVLSNDVNFINTITRSLKAGTVWVNCYNVFESAVPFGGYKSSGIGRDKGEYALENYTVTKAVYQSLEDNQPWI